MSGGRCQFRGCNKPLWRDSLTFQETNYSNIAHIVSWTPKGPRGHETRSAKLAQNFKNLMLVCRDHNKTIDDKKLEHRYPEKLLLSFKKEHEDRIRTLCDIKESSKTHVLILKGMIGEHTVSIDEQDAYQAILPRYPADETGIHIDVTSFSSDSPDYWKLCAQQIETEIASKLKGRNDQKKVNHISAFGFAPIPVLMKLGYIIGDKIPSDMYQYHRDTQMWAWPGSNEPHPAFSLKCVKKSSSNDVALLLSISGTVQEKELQSVFKDKDTSVYEISAPNPGFLFMRSKEQLVSFRSIYLHALSEIRAIHGQDSEIHLFPAVPLSIAIECGRSILPKVHPKIHIYDSDKKHGGYRYIFELQGANA